MAILVASLWTLAAVLHAAEASEGTVVDWYGSLHTDGLVLAMSFRYSISYRYRYVVLPSNIHQKTSRISTVEVV